MQEGEGGNLIATIRGLFAAPKKSSLPDAPVNPKSLLPAIVLFTAATAGAQTPVGVNGVIGSEWDGITPKQVTYSVGAPNSNFQSPTNLSDTVSYSIWMRSDSNFIYVGLRANPAGPGLDAWTTGNSFANLYFDLNPLTVSGSDLGFEIGQSSFHPFIPGGQSGSTQNLTIDPNNHFFSAISAGVNYPNAQGGVIEVAIPWSYLEGGYAADFTPGTTLPPVNHLNDSLNTIRLNLSQSFGFSVAGGQGFYGYERLGVVPEPATVIGGGFATALLGYTVARRRKLVQRAV